MNIFQQLFQMTEFCMVDHSTHLWSMDILSTNISPGSVATHSRDGEIFYYCFTKNLLLSLLVKIFLKKCIRINIICTVSLQISQTQLILIFFWEST